MTVDVDYKIIILWNLGDEISVDLQGDQRKGVLVQRPIYQLLSKVWE